MNKSTFISLLIIVVVLLTAYFLFPKQNQPPLFSSPTPTSIEKKINNNNNQSKLADMYQIFFMDFNYDPSHNSITLIDKGKEWDSKPLYTADMPTATPDVFMYRVKAVADKEVIHDGWTSLSKKIIQTSEGNLLFRVKTIYRPNTTIKVYLPGNKPLWSGNNE